LTESSPLQFTRLQDDQPPVVRSFELRGSVLPGNQIIERHPYQINIEVEDTESGVESAILRRNGLIIAAQFEDGSFTVNEKGAQKDESLEYVLEVRDRAGNRYEFTEIYNVVEDAAPDILAFGFSPNPVIEQRSEEHTSELQSRENLVCRLLLEKKTN